MSNGIKPASAIFQRKLEGEVKHVPLTVVNIDDILISGTDTPNHVSNVLAVLDRLTELGVTLNLDKCKFFQKEVEYVGFILGETGIRTNPEKVKAVIDAPEPRNINELQSFLGALNYYAKFINNKSTVAAPLFMLLWKNTKWKWTEKEKSAFGLLRMKLTKAPLLCLYDKQLPIRSACDASTYGVGAVLSHVNPDNYEKPIAFASRRLNNSEMNYSQLDKEALAIIFGVGRFRQYLFGRKFTLVTLVTDNKALSYMLNPNASIPPLAASRLVRWTLMLANYDFDVVFKSTKEHYNADMVSRVPLKDNDSKYVLNAINILQIDNMPISHVQMQRAVREDNVLSKIVKCISTDDWPNVDKSEKNIRSYFNKRNDLSLEDGILMFGLRVIVPEIYRKVILAELHNGHPGIIRMKGLARIHVWYPGIDVDIETTVKSCYECSKNQNRPPKAIIHPWDWPTSAFDRVHIDFF